MKKLLLLLLLLPTLALAQKTPQGVVYEADILRVNDGDTVVIAAPYLPQPLRPQLSVRIFGVDTPETGSRAKCEAENQRGLAAKAFTRSMVKQSKQHQVALFDWDKYGGRVLGDIILDGKSLRFMLLENGYAKEYYGGTKSSWCR